VEEGGGYKRIDLPSVCQLRAVFPNLWPVDHFWTANVQFLAWVILFGHRCVYVYRYLHTYTHIFVFSVGVIFIVMFLRKAV
jgi:hypothetical protein